MKQITKYKIQFYSVVSAVFIFIIFIFVCHYQIKQYNMRPAFNGIEGIALVRRFAKSDLDYMKIKDNLYLCKDGKGVEMLKSEFDSFASPIEEVCLYGGDDAVNTFKGAIVITKDGEIMITSAGCLDVPEGHFHFVGLKEYKNAIDNLDPHYTFYE